MARMKEKTWADYDIGDPTQVTTAVLQKAVRKAAKAANQRLLRLERAGLASGAYDTAMRSLGGTRKRFKENPNKLNINELRHEYRAIRSFMSLKGSTVQGRKDTEVKRYLTALENGFEGTLEDFIFQIKKAFTTENEKLFDSNIIYEAVMGGDLDILETVAVRSKEPENKGKNIIRFMKATMARKKARARP